MARKTRAQQKKGQSNNRIKPLIDKLIGTEKAEDLFAEVMVVLSDSQEKIPVVNGIYCLEYYAVTSPLLTDRFPIVGVTGVYEWGFSGMNLHLGEPRNYNFNNVSSALYRLKPQEVASARTLPLMDLYDL